MWYNRDMSKYTVMEIFNGKETYTKIVKSLGFGKGYISYLSLGNTKGYKENDSEYLEKLKKYVKNIDIDAYEKDELKKHLKNEFLTKVEKVLKNNGIEQIYSVIKELKIFESFDKNRKKQFEEILKYQIASRIMLNKSVIKSYSKKDDYINNITTKKDTFYSLLDEIYDNESNIMQYLNENISEKTNRNVELVFFDSTTVYFESFVYDGLKRPGYSKDGKFKEDQVVIGMATDNNGIPIYINTMPGNTADSATMMPFIIKLKKFYNISNITIISDKGMSTNKNLRFLEDLGINYIISQRLRAASKAFKEYVKNQDDYVQINDDLKYKILNSNSQWKGGRENGTIRKRVIVYSKSRAKMDEFKRNQLVDNFRKKAKVNGQVSAKELNGIKKYRYFQEVGNSFYVLDTNKVKEDSELDGYYIYETTRHDLSNLEIVNIYSNQYKIEENFRTLKSELNVRPVYVRNEKHIKGHFILCFLALVVLKYSLFKIKKYIDDNGLVAKITNETFIDTLNRSYSVLEIKNGKIIHSEPISYDKDSERLKNYQIIVEAINGI